jgi:large repetitive protein
MKRIFYIAAILLTLLLFQVFATTHTQGNTPATTHRNGELLVKFKDGPYAPLTAYAHAQTGATVLQNFDSIGWQWVKLPEGMSVEEGLTAYHKISDCLLAQPNYIYQIYLNPNDPRYVTPPGMYGLTKISAPAAWDTTTGNPAVVVADIDTGVDYNHEDLAANMWHNPGETPNNLIDDDNNGYVDDYYGYDFINHDSNPQDGHSHGTHTTGTIGAAGNNGLGVVGVNWNVKLMALKTHADNGNSTAATVIEAFNYVTMMRNRGHNIRVTNNSWGGAPEAAGYDQALKDAIDATGNAGVLNVFAAGNDNRNTDVNPAYPASYNSPSILSVASSTSTDVRSGFSNWGLTTVDVAAPGSSILSTFPGNNYGTISGTSMASPHAAGAAALLVGINPNLSVASLKATLMNTVDPLPAFSTLVASGGRINVANALANQTVCNFLLSQTSRNFPAAAASGSVTVTAQAACSWGAFSNANWITVTSLAGATGNGTVNFTVAQNSGGARSGTISIAGQTFTVMQGASFLDVSPSHPFYTEIGKLSAAGITLGCGGSNYCPDQVVTREQMAAFILRSLGEFNPPTPGSQRYLDVPPSNPFYNFIDRLAVLNITLGCNATNYCPTDTVLREQMAAFLLRAKGEFTPPVPGSQRFNDVPPSNPFYNFIDRLAVLNITQGCSVSPPLYCPTGMVTRAEMAAFLVRAFNL